MRAWGQAQRRRRVTMECGGCELQADGQCGWLNQSHFCPRRSIFYTADEDLASHTGLDTSGPQVLLQLWWVFAALFWLDVSKHPCVEHKAISPILSFPVPLSTGSFPHTVLSRAQVMKTLTTLARAPLDNKGM